MFKYLMVLSILVTGCGQDSSSNEPSTAPDASPADAATPGPTPVVGANFYVDTESGRWVTPEGTERLLSLAPDGLALWLSVHRVEAGAFDFMMAVGDADGQNTCIRTIVMPNLVLDTDGHFQFGPTDFTIPNGTTAEELVLEGKLSEDLSQITEIRARARLVVTSVPPTILPLMEGVDACGVVSALLQADCIPCSDGEVGCLDIEIAEYVGTARPDVTIEEVMLSDCHEGCEASAENMDCDL